MRLYSLIFILSTFYLIISVPVNAGHEGIVYKETLEAYARIDGETFRWETTREFILKEYEFIQINESGELIKAVEMQILYNTQRGLIETIIEPVKGANFELTPTFLKNGSVEEFAWDMFLFRDINHPRIDSDPFDENIRSNFTQRSGHRRFDLESDKKFFTVNLEYFEFQVDDGKVKKLRVNTELSSNNADDGRVIKTAMHIIKRDGDTVLFDYNWNIQEVSTVYRYYNLLDQPYLLVPYQIGSVLLLYFIYDRIHRYWKKNNYRIIKVEAELEPEEKEKESGET